MELGLWSLVCGSWIIEPWLWSLGCYPSFSSSHQMKMSYKGFKDIRIDFIKIWSKMCSFNASIGLLPFILIV